MSNMSNTTECYKFPNNPEKCAIILYCKYVACSLSILGSITVLTLMLVLKKYKEFTQRLIAYLSVMSLVLAVSCTLRDFDNSTSTLCIIQGATLEFCSVAVIYWVNIITVNLYLSVFYDRDLRHCELVLSIFSMAIPAACTAAPFFGDHVYGPAGPWCWLADVWEWRFGAWYIWRLLTFFVMMLVVIRIICHLNVYSQTRQSASDTMSVNDDIRTLKMYPIVYFLVNVFPVVNRIQNAIRPDEPVFALFLLQACTDPLFGVVIAIVFLLDTKTRHSITIINILQGLHSCTSRSAEINDYPVQEHRL